MYILILLTEGMILSDNMNKGTNNPENMDEFFATEFEGGRHLRRVEKMAIA